MRKPKRIRRKTNPAYAVVVDGKTEVWYLQMLKRNERNIRVTIKPEIPNRKSIKEQYDLVCKLLAQEYTKVFWILDFDTVIKEERESPKGKESPIGIFNQYKEKLSKRNGNYLATR